MSNRKHSIVTGFRLIAMITLLVVLYRNEKLEILFTAITIFAICFWVIPHCLASMVMIIFKLKDDFGGTLLFDDADPTDCRFRMIFNFDPEDLVKEPTFTVKCERADIRNELISRDKNTD